VDPRHSRPDCIFCNNWAEGYTPAFHGGCCYFNPVAEKNPGRERS
jgi:hypothetical protein